MKTFLAYYISGFLLCVIRDLIPCDICGLYLNATLLVILTVSAFIHSHSALQAVTCLSREISIYTPKMQHQEQVGDQYLAQGHFDMSTTATGD